MPDENSQTTEETTETTEITEEIQFEEETWLNESNVAKFQIAYKVFLAIIGLIVLINVLIPVFLRRDPSYVVTKTGCIGIDVNEGCIGIAKYSREIRKSAEFEEQP